MSKIKRGLSIGLFVLCSCVLPVFAEESSDADGGELQIDVQGLMKNMVVLNVNGVHRILKVGSTSPEGITLISSDIKQAKIKLDGKVITLGLSTKIGANYKTPEREITRVARGVGGHYFAHGKINKHSAQFLVDTGATSVAMNSLYAQALGIDYSKSTPLSINTASGITPGYKVMLSSVSVGSVTVNNVEAVVVEGSFPTEILLGNSFLSRVEMNVDEGVLVLQSKY
ncbi:MAG: aspartyl protease family protein [Lentisphaeria bacterium]|jgi:aspartyl protease family protein